MKNFLEDNPLSWDQIKNYKPMLQALLNTHKSSVSFNDYYDLCKQVVRAYNRYHPDTEPASEQPVITSGSHGKWTIHGVALPYWNVHSGSGSYNMKSELNSDFKGYLETILTQTGLDKFGPRRIQHQLGVLAVKNCNLVVQQPVLMCYTSDMALSDFNKKYGKKKTCYTKKERRTL